MPVGIGFQTRALKKYLSFISYIILLTVSNLKIKVIKNAIKDVLLFLKTSKSISLTFMAQNQHTHRKTKYFSKKLPGREKLGIIVSKELKTLLFKQRFQ